MRTFESTPPALRPLLSQRISQLGLKLEGSRVERYVQILYRELEHKGLKHFRPRCYLTDEWGCPSGEPIIGIPFYLADANLAELEKEIDDVEDAREILMYLRHEAGHAFNYAYRLYETPEWTELFGPFARPYPDDYAPQPFSRSFVRHLPAWYAQKHPDEDAAETFAVWLDPLSNWREVYADWNCLPKLVYFDDLARRIGSQPPPLTADGYDTSEEFLTGTVAEYYRRMAPTPVQVPHVFDAALRDVFPLVEGDASSAEPAAEFLRRRRRAIVTAVHYWTGLDDAPVRALLGHLEQRCGVLRLCVGRDAEARLIELVALVTTLCMNRLRTGDFVGK